MFAVYKFIKNNKFLFLIVRVLIYYLLICNICANIYYHIGGDEKVEKVVVKAPKQQEIVITSEDILEKVNRQFHVQLLFSSGVGTLKQNSEESVKILFYNEENEKIKGFRYELNTKRVYPGELQLPKKTEQLMDEVANVIIS